MGQGRHTLVDALVDRALREPLISGGSRRDERKGKTSYPLRRKEQMDFVAAAVTASMRVRLPPPPPNKKARREACLFVWVAQAHFHARAKRPPCGAPSSFFPLPSRLRRAAASKINTASRPSKAGVLYFVSSGRKQAKNELDHGRTGWHTIGIKRQDPTCSGML